MLQPLWQTEWGDEFKVRTVCIIRALGQGLSILLDRNNILTLSLFRTFLIPNYLCYYIHSVTPKCGTMQFTMLINYKILETSPTSLVD